MFSGLKKRIYIGLLLTSFLTVSSFFYAYFNLNLSIEASKEIKTHLQVWNQIKIIMLKMKDAEITQRNFLLTHDTQYLTHYVEDKNWVQEQLLKLRELISTFKYSSLDFSEFYNATENSLGLMAKIADNITKHREAEAIHIIQSRQGSLLTAQIEEKVRVLESSQGQLILAENAQISKQAYTLFFNMLITGIACLSLFLVLLFYVYRLGKLQEAESQIEALQKRIEQKTLESNQLKQLAEANAERYRLILEGSNDGIWEWDLRHHEVKTNVTYRKLLGLKTDITDSFFFNHLLHPDDRPLVQQALTGHFKGKQPYIVDMRLKNQETQEYIPVLAHGTAIFDADGSPIKMSGTHSDLRLLKKTESALKQSEMKFRRIAESQMIGIIFASLEGLIEEANDYFLELTGYQSVDIATHPLSLFELTPPQYHALDHYWIQTALKGEKVKAYEKQFIHRDGRLIDVVVGFALQEKSNNQIVAFILDNTTAKKAQIATQQYAQQLKESNQELENFATIVSHDIQAPLRKIIIFSEFIQDSLQNQLDPSSQDYLSRIHKSALRLQVFVTNLLEFSRVTRKGKPFTTVSLEDVMKNVVENLRPLIQEKNASLTCVLNETLQADEYQMEQVFQNLLENALKYSKAERPPRITLKAHREDDDFIHISVQDNGIGIPKEYFNKIFEIFQRLSIASREEQGSGVGLATVKKIIQRHQGEIWVESELGQGSCFHIKLPVQQPLSLPQINGTFSQQSH